MHNFQCILRVELRYVYLEAGFSGEVVFPFVPIIVITAHVT